MDTRFEIHIKGYCVKADNSFMYVFRQDGLLLKISHSDIKLGIIKTKYFLKRIMSSDED